MEIKFYFYKNILSQCMVKGIFPTFHRQVFIGYIGNFLDLSKKYYSYRTLVGTDKDFYNLMNRP